MTFQHQGVFTERELPHSDLLNRKAQTIYLVSAYGDRNIKIVVTDLPGLRFYDPVKIEDLKLGGIQHATLQLILQIEEQQGVVLVEHGAGSTP